MTNFNNYDPDYGTGTRTYMDVDTGDITVVHDNGCGGGSIFHIKGTPDEE